MTPTPPAGAGAAVPSRWHVAEEAPRRVVIAGASLDEVTRALAVADRLREALGRTRNPQETAQRDGFDDVVALLTDLGGQIPPASLSQAERGAAHRRALLASGSYTHEELRQMREDGLSSSTRTWVTRQRARHRLFTVTHQRRALVPAFLLDRDGNPRPELQPLLAELDAAAVPGWQRWTWLTTGSAALGGRPPQDVARSEPARALAAVQQFTARLRVPVEA